MTDDRRFAWRTLIAAQAGVALLAVTSAVDLPTKLVWNASASVPIGLYTIEPIGRMNVTQLVLARPPEPLAAFLADSGYVGVGVPLLKRIAALPGQTVCRDGLDVKVDGVTWATARERDRLGRPLPRWAGCRTLTDGEVFLMNWEEPSSLDGRYFGPLPARSIVGRATPVWTREDD